MARRNLRGISLCTTALALAMSAGAAWAQNAPADTAVETVVVTGSHIHGVAPVGSPLLSVAADEMQKQGAQSPLEVLKDLPQVTNLGASSESTDSPRNLQGGAGNQTYANSLNLRGLGTQNTLNLVNGMRLTAEQTGDIWDIDAVPSLLIQRIDIVADGGSATYGADAITGTANLILKAPTDVFEVMVSGNHDKGQTGYQGGVLLGKTWNAPGLGDGGLIVAVQYTHGEQLHAIDRPRSFNDNVQQFLGPTGAGLSTFTNPGNLVIGANSYAVPTGVGGTQGITLSQLGPVSQPRRQSIFNSLVSYIPSNERTNGGFNFKQDVTDWLNLFANGYAQFHRARTINGNLNQTFTVPNTNPYSPCATAAAAALAGRTAPPLSASGISCPANGTVSVQGELVGEMGGTGRRGTDKQITVAGGVNVALPYAWKGTLETSVGQDYSVGDNEPGVNSTALAQVLSGTNKPSNVPFLNPFCDDHVTGPACNDPLTLSYIHSRTRQIYTNRLTESTINLDGPVYQLPAGSVRLALGAEYDNESLYANSDSTTSAAIGLSIADNIHARRNVVSVYGELYVPLIGPENAIPGIQSLELTLADRYTDYSDFGVTNNPKYGFNYSPFDGLKLRGSYGTSFRSPSLRDASSEIATSLHATNSANSNNYAGIVAPPNVNLADVEATGGYPAIQPETAITWSLGMDWAPHDIEGLDLDLDYYNISAKQVIGQVARDVGDPGIINATGHIYDSYLVLNPTYFPTRAVVTDAVLQLNPSLTRGAALTQAQYNAIITSIYANPIYGFPNLPTQPIIFFCQCQRSNGGTTSTDGLDLAANYEWSMGWAEAHVGGSATYVLNDLVGITNSSPIVDENNFLTYPLRFSARLHAGLDHDEWSGNLYLNFKNAYKADPTQLPPGAPAQYTHISAYTTLDASISYTPDADAGFYLAGSRLSLAVTNLANEGPPFVLDVAVDYDPTQASILGRRIVLTLDKKF